MEPAAEHSRSSQTWLILSAAAIAASLIGVVYHQMSIKPDVPVDVSGFDVSSVSQTPLPTQARKVSQPADGGGIMVAKDTSGLFAKPGGGPAALSMKTRESEQDFVKRHNQEIRDSRKRLKAISDRYYKKYQVVRDVDAAFGKLDRYMAAKKRYDQDQDFFAFARDTLALPEVRGLIQHYMVNPEAWHAGIGMVEDALREQPPKDIYSELLNFMTTDPSMTSFVKNFMQDVVNNVSALTQGLPPGADTRQLQGLAQQFAPGSAIPTTPNPAH